MVRRLGPALLGVALAISMIACGTGSQGTGSTIKEGDRLRVAIGIDPDTLDPAQQTTTTSQQVIDMMVETLVTIDANGALKPLLAEKWDQSSDGLTYTFHLRKGVKFHDGTDFNAAAVAFSLNRLCCDPKTFKPQPGLLSPKTGGIETVKPVDDSTVKVTLKTPQAPFLAELTQTVAGIVCPNSVNQAPNTPATIAQPCGTGPYKFAERQNGDHITMTRFDQYWGQKANYRTQEYRVLPDGTSREAAVKSGQIDVAYLPPANDLPALEHDGNLRVLLGPSDRTLQIVINTDDASQPLLQKKEVRQALNYAVDKNAIVKNVMFGAGTVLDSPMSKSLFGYCSTGQYNYDPAKAKSMLASAGASNLKIKMYAPTGRYVQDIQVAQAVAQNLRDAGVQVDGPTTSDWPSYLATVNVPPDKAKADLHFLGWAPSYLDAQKQFEQFQSAFWPPAGLATSYYKNPDVDALVGKANVNPDPNGRKQQYCEAAKLVWDDAPWIFMYTQKNPVVYSSKVTNVTGLPNEKFVTTWASPA